MIDNSNSSDSPKEYKEEKCDEEKNTFLCDFILDRKKYSTLSDSL